MSTNYIRTFSGEAFPVEPSADSVKLVDLAIGLSRAPRWGGHSSSVYPVSAHSIFVSRLLPDSLKLQGLLHDGSEAYLADLPSPFKSLLPDYKKLEMRLMLAIADRFKFPWPLGELVKAADAVALYEERKRLFPDRYSYDIPTAIITQFPGLNQKALSDWDWGMWLDVSPHNHAERFVAEFNEIVYGHQ